ncbi:MAG TPA: condensation domain-containing protein, partial [Puia sp.]|nr:condensation domain-containing protein [Puia sp.]
MRDQVEKVIGVTWQQRRMLQSLAAASVPYANAISIRMEKDARIAELGSICSRLVERHEAFRTGFEFRDGGWRQIIYQPVDVVPSECVLGNSGLAGFYRQFGTEFTIDSYPLFRFTVCRSENECYLVLEKHLLVSDEASDELIVREIRDMASGRSAPGKPATLHSDYTLWQDKFLVSQRGREMGQYWEKYADLHPG